MGVIGKTEGDVMAAAAEMQNLFDRLQALQDDKDRVQTRLADLTASIQDIKAQIATQKAAIKALAPNLG